MKARDLFAGLGWSIACRDLGIEDHGVEWDDNVREARRLNGLTTVGRDVRDVDGSVGSYELEIASPPCERFTQTGHGDGSRAREEIIKAVNGLTDRHDVYSVIRSLNTHHEKIGLVLEPFRVLLENPHAKAAIWEQVVTVLPIWEAIAVKLRGWGWSVDTRNVNAAWYGVPQDRRRAVLLARRDGKEARIPGDMQRRTMRSVFPGRDGWVQRSNYSAPAVAGRRTAQERGRTMRTIDQLSVTMTRKAAQWIHPDGSVTKMTVADMAAVQTFPEDIVFAGGVQDQRLQVGNAVPPRMAGVLIQAATGSIPNSKDGNAPDDDRENEMTIIEAAARPTARRERTGSAVVRLLEKVWGRIRENHPELPDVVMVTGIGIGAGSNKWGHFAADGWTAKSETGNVRVHEMFMAGETLAKGANQVLQTMLHEGAHALAKTRGKQDTSRQGRWHNKVFRDMATEMGLEHRSASADKAHGYSFVTLTADTIAEYADLLTELEAEIHLMVSLPGWLGGTDEDDKGGELIGKKPPTGENKSSGVKLVCQCAEPNIIRASKKVAAKKILICEDCDNHFTEADA